MRILQWLKNGAALLILVGGMMAAFGQSSATPRHITVPLQPQNINGKQFGDYINRGCEIMDVLYNNVLISGFIKPTHAHGLVSPHVMVTTWQLCGHPVSIALDTLKAEEAWPTCLRFDATGTQNFTSPPLPLNPCQTDGSLPILDLSASGGIRWAMKSWIISDEKSWNDWYANGAKNGPFFKTSYRGEPTYPPGTEVPADFKPLLLLVIQPAMVGVCGDYQAWLFAKFNRDQVERWGVMLATDKPSVSLQPSGDANPEQQHVTSRRIRVWENQPALVYDQLWTVTVATDHRSVILQPYDGKYGMVTFQQELLPMMLTAIRNQRAESYKIERPTVPLPAGTYVVTDTYCKSNSMWLLRFSDYLGKQRRPWLFDSRAAWEAYTRPMLLTVTPDTPTQFSLTLPIRGFIIPHYIAGRLCIDLELQCADEAWDIANFHLRGDQAPRLDVKDVTGRILYSAVFEAG